jgi:hypothetical protein
MGSLRQLKKQDKLIVSKDQPNESFKVEELKRQYKKEIQFLEQTLFKLIDTRLCLNDSITRLFKFWLASFAFGIIGLALLGIIGYLVLSITVENSESFRQILGWVDLCLIVLIMWLSLKIKKKEREVKIVSGDIDHLNRHINRLNKTLSQIDNYKTVMYLTTRTI